MLCFDLDNQKIKTVYVIPHDLANLKVRPVKVYDGVNCFEWENGPMADLTV